MSHISDCKLVIKVAQIGHNFNDTIENDNYKKHSNVSVLYSDSDKQRQFRKW